MTSPGSREDLEQKRAALRLALDRGDAENMRELAEDALLSCELGETNAMIGIVDVELVDTVAELAREALLRAAVATAEDPEGRREAAELIWAHRRADLADTAVTFVERERAEDEDGQMSYLLGLFAFHGFGVDQDRAASLAHHREAAAKGHADAMFELSVMLDQGLGADADAEAALDWTRRAAEAGSARAMYNLGAYHATGRGVGRDMEASRAWYLRAAEEGHGRAAATLGVMYASGDGVPETDKKRATELFELAEEAGYDWVELAEAAGLDVDDFL